MLFVWVLLKMDVSNTITLISILCYMFMMTW